MRLKKYLSLAIASTLLSSGICMPAYGMEKTSHIPNTITSNTHNNSFKDYIKDIQKNEQKIRSFLKDNDVKQDTIEKLINKLYKGEIWDCLKKDSKDIKTVSTIKTNNSTITKKYTYPDGSIKILSQTPTINMSRSISGGKWSSGSGYHAVKGAKIAEYTGIANASFYADFATVNGGFDYIDRVYDKDIVTYGGTYSTEFFDVVYPRETCNYPAEAKLEFQFAAFNGSTARTCRLKLIVGNDDYYSVIN